MTPENKTELHSINTYAKNFLKRGDEALPTKLHNALNTVFTKDYDKYSFRKKVILKHKIDGKTNYAVLQGKTNAIYNALCLIAFVGVGPTKKIFQRAVQIRKKENLTSLLEQTQEQALIYFCLGVQSANLAELKVLLQSDDFDLFTQKLPSPFRFNNSGQYNLTPMLTFFDKSIPWQEYVDDYQHALESYESKNIDIARQQLNALTLKAAITLPVVAVLLCRIIEKEAEAKEASNYIQTLLDHH